MEKETEKERERERGADESNWREIQGGKKGARQQKGGKKGKGKGKGKGGFVPFRSKTGLLIFILIEPDKVTA